MKVILPSSSGNPYLAGNWAPVRRELRPTPCTIVQGALPSCLRAGQYVRNGGNSLKHSAESEADRDSHWFDGDGMLTGVLFPSQEDDASQDRPPLFINRYILTDVLLNTSSKLRSPMIPSISTFAASLTFTNSIHLLFELFRAVVLAFLSWLPFQQTTRLKRISVANTSVYWHDGRAFASCESGPPIRILLPGLETADWWTGRDEEASNGWSKGVGPLKMLNEFTTAHPRVDPVTQELLLYHMSFVQPYLRVSVVPPQQQLEGASTQPIFGAAVPGMLKPKLAHDFAATRTRTIIIDLPLVLDPRNLLRGRPMLSYEPDLRTRFGVFPRRDPGQVRWYESDACCIYHTANAWDDDDGSVESAETSASLVACRLNSATLVYAAGNITPPAHAVAASGIERCQLYYWQFGSESSSASAPPSSPSPSIRYEFALSNIPFEFPTMNEGHAMRANRYVYGATMSSGTFDAGLGTRTAKIDCIAKVDIRSLIAEGKQRSDSGDLPRGSTVDERTVRQVLDEGSAPLSAAGHRIRIFALPPHHYAQEATFIRRKRTESEVTEQQEQDEDDGYLVFFVFDEATGLDPRTGHARHDATSELWVLDARTMSDVVCRVRLPQRVPYGLHGRFFSEAEIAAQRPVRAVDVRNWTKGSARPDAHLIGAMDGKALSPMEKGVPNAVASRATQWFRSNVESMLA